MHPAVGVAHALHIREWRESFEAALSHCHTQGPQLGVQAVFLVMWHSPHSRRTVENVQDRILISLMDVGQRCLTRDEICRFYYRVTIVKRPAGLHP